MTTTQFLLAMSFGRILLMVGAICWLLVTDADRDFIVSVMALVCFVMLASNLINVVVVVAVLKVTLW